MSKKQALEREHAAADEQKNKDRDLALLAHDIRNPLAAVVNGVQILRQSGTKGPLAEQTLDLIDRQLKQIIRLMDELLLAAVQSEETRGEGAMASSPSHGSHATSLRLLVVEDNRDVAKSLASMLRLWGHEVSVAYDGVQALTVADENSPQVVLLDLDLPGLDGCTVARHLKTSSRSKAARLIAVTASGDEDHRRQVREAGFHFHLVKPVAPSALKQLLASLDIP